MDEEEWSLSPETDEETHADRSPATTPAGSTPSPELSSFREAAPEKTSVLRPASSLEAPSIQSPEREEPPLSPLSFDELLELLTDEERWWSSPEADEQAHIDERAGAPPAQEISAVWAPAPHNFFIPHPASPSKASQGPCRRKRKMDPEPDQKDHRDDFLQGGRHREPATKRPAQGDGSDAQTTIGDGESATRGEDSSSRTAVGHAEAKAKPEAKPRLPRAD